MVVVTYHINNSNTISDIRISSLPSLSVSGGALYMDDFPPSGNPMPFYLTYTLYGRRRSFFGNNVARCFARFLNTPATCLHCFPFPGMIDDFPHALLIMKACIVQLWPFSFLATRGSPFFVKITLFLMFAQVVGNFGLAINWGY